MVSFILYLILFVIIDFVVIACWDGSNADLSRKRPLHSELYMPYPSQIPDALGEGYGKASICDVRKHNDKMRDKIDEYTKTVIIPAHDYFKLQKELEGKADSMQMTVLILPLFSFLSILVKTIKTFPAKEYHMSGFWHGVVCFVILLVFAVAISFVNYFIYTRTIKIEPSRYDNKHFETDNAMDDARRHYSYYGISDDAAMNNHIIFIHGQYLESIKNRIRRRHIASTIAAVVVLLLYVYLRPISY